MAFDQLRSLLRVAFSFIHARYWLRFSNRQRLQAWQQRQLARHLRRVAPRAERFRPWVGKPLERWPCMDKRMLMEQFSACNTRGVPLAAALAVARQAEISRDFSPQLGDLTVGLSSGTSGQPGVFLVSRAERERWAGVLLARTLPRHLLAHLLPWREPLRIAFFLRANSRLYGTLASRRIDFVFHDLLDGVDAALPNLERQRPHVLVAPATVLRGLAEAVLDGRLAIEPVHVISVAEVLESEDAARIEQAFGIRPAQIYQASEGFLGYSCEAGSLHLNETHLHVEPEWLNVERRRFQPCISDFSRTTQTIIRYRLNDILRVAPQPCRCGRAELTIEAIEGRADEVLWLPAFDGSQLRPLYPDLLRRMMLMAAPTAAEWSIRQYGERWTIALQHDALSHCRVALEQAVPAFCREQGVRSPTLHFSSWQPAATGAKRRRLLLEQLPEGLACTY